MTEGRLAAAADDHHARRARRQAPVDFLRSLTENHDLTRTSTDLTNPSTEADQAQSLRESDASVRLYSAVRDAVTGTIRSLPDGGGSAVPVLYLHQGFLSFLAN
jgi:hypothetical protein